MAVHPTENAPTRHKIPNRTPRPSRATLLILFRTGHLTCGWDEQPRCHTRGERARARTLTARARTPFGRASARKCRRALLRVRHEKRGISRTNADPARTACVLLDVGCWGRS